MRSNRFLVHTLAILTVLGLAAPSSHAVGLYNSDEQAALVAASIMCSNVFVNLRVGCVADLYPQLLQVLREKK